MNLWSFFVAEIGLFSLLQWLWIPAVERRLATNRSPVAIGNFMLLAVLGVLRGVLIYSCANSPAAKKCTRPDMPLVPG